MKQQELRGQVGKRVAGRVVGPGGAEMKRAGKRQIEGKRGEMQRIDAGEATPEEAADRCGIVDRPKYCRAMTKPETTKNRSTNRLKCQVCATMKRPIGQSLK